MEQFRVVSQWSVCPPVQGLDGAVQSCQSVVRLSCCTGVRWNSSELSVVRLSCCTDMTMNCSMVRLSCCTGVRGHCSGVSVVSLCLWLSVCLSIADRTVSNLCVRFLLSLQDSFSESSVFSYLCHQPTCDTTTALYCLPTCVLPIPVLSAYLCSSCTVCLPVFFLYCLPTCVLPVLSAYLCSSCTVCLPVFFPFIPVLSVCLHNACNVLPLLHCPSVSTMPVTSF